MPSVEWFILEGVEIITNSEYIETAYLQKLFLVSNISEWKQYLSENIELFTAKTQQQTELSKFISK